LSKSKKKPAKQIEHNLVRTAENSSEALAEVSTDQ